MADWSDDEGLIVATALDTQRFLQRKAAQAARVIPAAQYGIASGDKILNRGVVT
jgi:hypothetical protein